MLSDLLELMEDKGVKKAIWTCLTGRACTSHTALLLAWIVWSCWIFVAEKESCAHGKRCRVNFGAWCQALPTVLRTSQQLKEALSYFSGPRAEAEIAQTFELLFYRQHWSCFFAGMKSKLSSKSCLLHPFAVLHPIAWCFIHGSGWKSRTLKDKSCHSTKMRTAGGLHSLDALGKWKLGHFAFPGHPCVVFHGRYVIWATRGQLVASEWYRILERY